MVPTDPAEPPENPSPPSPWRCVGRYELMGELGSGAMGTVWRARDTRLDREVAVKEVHLPHGMPPRERERARARMVREAQAAARVSHPSVVTVHDVLEADGVPFIVMELLEGESLRERLKRSGPLAEAEVERIARPLLGALWAAHRAGVVHRDVKPANIVLTEGGARPVLTDFGIANLPDHEGTALTGTGAVLGTAAYAAPERLENDGTSAVSDLWSLGTTLFEALAGVSPFRRETLTATLTAVLTQPVPPPPARGRLASVVGGLLERDPRRRLLPEQALSLLDAPEPNRPVAEAGHAFSGQRPSAPTGPTAAVPPAAPAPGSRPGRSRAPLWVAGAAALLAVLVLGGLALRTLVPWSGGSAGSTGADGAGTAAGGVAASEEPGPSPEPSGPELPETVTDDAPEGFVRLDDGVVGLILPEDWEVRDGDLRGGGESVTRLSSYELGTGVETGTATVVATRYDVLLHDAESAMLRMEELLREDEDFSDVRRQGLDTERMEGGLQGAVYEVLFHHEEREFQERWMFSREITDGARGISYRLSFNFPAELREEYREDFRSMLDSFGPAAGGN
ncbi:protein kinase domain-containing protein [Nocardiopsis terrae]